MGNNNTLAKRLLALSNLAGRQIFNINNWSFLRRETNFSTKANISLYCLEDDFDRFISDTMWNRTRNTKLRLLNVQDFQAFQSLPTDPAITQVYTIIEDEIQIFPVPTSTEVIDYYYMSNEWAKNTGGVTKTSFTLDTDTTVFPELLVELSVKWRVKESKGATHAADLDEFNRTLDREIARDGDNTALFVTPIFQGVTANIPATIPVV